jgi:hypothetical protein
MRVMRETVTSFSLEDRGNIRIYLLNWVFMLTRDQSIAPEAVVFVLCTLIAIPTALLLLPCDSCFALDRRIKHQKRGAGVEVDVFNRFCRNVLREL